MGTLCSESPVVYILFHLYYHSCVHLQLFSVSIYARTHTHKYIIHTFYLNYLRINCRICPFTLKHFTVLFPRDKSILLHNHNIVTKIRDFNNSALLSIYKFFSSPNNILCSSSSYPHPSPSLPDSLSRITHWIYLSCLSLVFNLED